MNGEVIQFSSFAALARIAKETIPPDALTSYRDERLARRQARLLEVTEAPETLSETCKNSRLRLALNRHASAVASCLLLGEQRKPYARIELFAF